LTIDHLSRARRRIDLKIRTGTAETSVRKSATSGDGKKHTGGE